MADAAGLDLAHLQSEHQASMLVRTLARIESGEGGTSMRRVAHAQALSLLLTPTSLRRTGYRVSPVEAVEDE